MTTPKLAMAELSASQASKEITHNDALRMLDALVQTGIQDKDLTTPPAHVHGNCWIVAASATGAWASQDGKIAQSYNSAWYFLTPKEGWRVWVNDENATYVYDGSAWAIQVLDVATAIHAATGKTTPVDADELGIADSAASYVLKKVTLANLKIATLQIKVGSFSWTNTDPSNATYDVTGLGMTPIGIIFFTVQDSGQASWNFADNVITSKGIIQRGDVGADKNYSGSGVAFAIYGDSSNYVTGTLVSMSSGAFRLNIQKTGTGGTGTSVVQYLVIGR